MKIKSIKLTSEYEVLKNEGYTFIGKGRYSPVYQVEYEETTPTGLTAKGTMELYGESLDKVMELFSALEKSLSVACSKHKEEKGEIDSHKVEVTSPFTKMRKSFEENFKGCYEQSTEPDTPFDDKPESDKDELMKFTTELATCLGVDDKFVDEIKKLFK